MQRYKLTIAYDGTEYCGWQRQVDPTPTVQRTVEKAAGSIVSHPVTVRGSSRTDTGVHAWGQVGLMEAETHLEPQRLRKAINSRLPGDVMIREMEVAPPEFNIKAAVHKRYRYAIWAEKDRPLFNRRYVYHYWHRVDVKLMQDACNYFVGTHDFNAFKANNEELESTVRTIFNCQIHRRGPLVLFGVEGSGFMYHMVRTMVGTVLDVGRGAYPASRIAEIIASRDRRQAGPCVPAQGLCLQWIRF